MLGQRSRGAERQCFRSLFSSSPTRVDPPEPAPWEWQCQAIRRRGALVFRSPSWGRPVWSGSADRPHITQLEPQPAPGRLSSSIAAQAANIDQAAQGTRCTSGAAPRPATRVAVTVTLQAEDSALALRASRPLDRLQSGPPRRAPPDFAGVARGSRWRLRGKAATPPRQRATGAGDSPHPRVSGGCRGFVSSAGWAGWGRLAPPTPSPLPLLCLPRVSGMVRSWGEGCG